MVDNQSCREKAISELLASDEPGPFKILNPIAESPILLVCDHASCRFPGTLGDMGLDPFARRCHLAIDIGAAALTARLAQSLNVTAVMARYSRLVIDCNRHLMDPGAFLEFGDGIVVPGNRNLQSAEKERRADAIYRPYHNAIDAQIERLKTFDAVPRLISVHSFTPVLNGVPRPWQMGVLWDTDTHTRDAFIDGFSNAGYVVGDNEPYSGKGPHDFTIDHHAEPHGLPHVGIEIRQDLIDHDDGVERVAQIMHTIVVAIPERDTATSERISA